MSAGTAPPSPRPQRLAVRRLDDALDAQRYGGKAANLARALRAGLPVPRGTALGVEALEAVTAGDGAARAVVTAALAALRPPLAVRSSAVHEDGAGASYAGQYASLVGVRDPGEVLAALARVHASAAGAEAYRHRLGLPGGGTAALVQEVVAAAVAGVLFTRDPLGSAGMRVEAAWGLGEAVVTGLVTPDRWLLDTGGGVLEAEVGDKDVAVHLDPARGGCRTEAVPGALRRVPCLDAGVLQRLVALAGRCEAVFGGAQDIEWALSGGRLHLLQARPLTTRTEAT